MTCSHCQEHLLHYLYDVLDPEERAQIARHLEECALCQEVRAALAAKQDLLAEAAKESFADVAFHPPVETPRRFPEPTQAFPARRQRGFSWVRVAMAAAVLLFVGGGGTMGVMGWMRAKHEIESAEARVIAANTDSQRHQEKVTKDKEHTKEEIRRIQEEINRLFKDWSDKASEERNAQQKRPRVMATFPSSIPAGSQPHFKFNVDNETRAIPAPAAAPQKTGAEDVTSATVRLVEQQSKRTIYEHNIAKLGPAVDVKLPPNLALEQGGRSYTWQVDLQDSAGKVVSREEANISAPEYLTHLMTDRPMYRPGEVVLFRSLTLERFTLKPAREDLHLIYQILDPKGGELFKADGAATLVTLEDRQPVKGPEGQPVRGIGAGEYQLPYGLPGGQYTLAVSEAQNRFPPEKRTFLVNQWQMPRMNKEIKFHRSSYGPGEKVEITASAKRGEDGKVPLAGQRAHVRVVVDTKTIFDAPLQTNAQGQVSVPFNLPAENLMPHGLGTVSVEFHDGAGPETIVRPIPIVLNKMNVEFFAEGGDLVQGVKNKVYFEARSTLGKPAELKGRLVDQTGATLANLETLHDDKEEGINQGQGAFTFVPAAGKRYQLQIDTPLGVKPVYQLPAAKSEGVVLHLLKPTAEEVVELEVTSADAQRSLLVGLYCRGRLLDDCRIAAPAGKTVPVRLSTTPGVGGVYRITVFEIKQTADGVQYVPRAERLTYHQDEQRLTVALDGIKEAYFPGDKAKLKLTAKDEKGKQTPAVGLALVRDLSLVKLADDKTDRLMPTHFLLTSEVRKSEDLENADVLLGKHPQAAAALDLLLGTQGWRRFAEQDPTRFRQQNPPAAAQRVLSATIQQHDSARDVIGDRVDKPYAAKAVKLLDQLAREEANENGPPGAVEQQKALESSAVAARQAAELAQAAMRDYERQMFNYLLGAIVIGTLLFGLGAIVVGVRRLGQGRPALAALVTGTALLLFLFMGSLAGVFYLIGSRGEMPLAVAKNDAVQVAAVAPAPKAPDMPAPQDAVPPPAPAMAKKEEKKDEPREALEPRGVPANEPRPVADRMVVADAKVAQRLVAPPRGPQPTGLPPVAQGMAQPGGPMPAQARGGAFANPANGQQVPGGPFGGVDNQAQLRQNFGGGFPGNFEDERQLRMDGNYREILARRMNRDIKLPPKIEPFYAREYAHRHADNQDEPRKDSVRRDFTETLFWQPALVFPNGEVEIAFDFSDSVTRYQVIVFSHSLDGRLGANIFELAARLPFSIDPKTPFEVANTDKLVIPVAVKNDTDAPGRVELTTKILAGLKTQDPQTRDVTLDAKDRSRAYFTFEPGVVQGDALLRVKGTLNAGQFGSDTVERSFKIVPDAFPFKGSASGLLEKTAVQTVTLPPTWMEGTLQAQVQLFPSTLAELQKGLEGLLREPNGCFEQSSSSNYPNVLILNYMQEAGQGDPNVEKRARQLLQNGYQRLTSFECIDPHEGAKRRGYEWFGQTAPPHEALTAYGLLQFHDMAKVYAVDNDMVERTTKYLLAQRDGQGGFKRNTRALDSFGRAPDHITNAYIVWALTDAGVAEDLAPELAALAAKAKESQDPYFLALVTLSHLNRGKTDEALGLAKKLKETQKEDGHLDGTQTSITGSQGRNLQLETTALTVLAWLKANRPDEFHTSVDKAVKWISAQRSGQGSFGATQSTILALKALIAHTRESKKIAEDGKLTVSLPDVNGKIVAETTFTAGVSEPITLTLGEGRGLKPGANRLVIETTGRNVLPYTIGWSYQTLTPPSDAGCSVKLSAKLNKFNVAEGDTVKLNATIENVTDKGHGMTVAILGLPAGLSIPEDAKQLRELAKLRDGGTKPGPISAWELRGRELVLYWRDLAPKAKIDVEVDLICRLPGTYRGPASRAYLYYDADHKNWIEPLGIVIEPQRVE